MHGTSEPGLVCVFAYDLLNSPRCEWLIQPRLEQKVIARMRVNTGLQGKSEV